MADPTWATKNKPITTKLQGQICELKEKAYFQCILNLNSNWILSDLTHWHTWLKIFKNLIASKLPQVRHQNQNWKISPYIQKVWSTKMSRLKLNTIYLQTEEKPAAETRGRIKFRLEYDFTLQELRVTVSWPINPFFNSSWAFEKVFTKAFEHPRTIHLNLWLWI